MARSAGAQAQLVGKEEQYALLKLPSGETRRVLVDCMATIGQVGNLDHENMSYGKAGRNRWRGRLGSVRGVVDTQGRIVKTYDYDAFGMPSVLSAPAVAYGFTGEQFDTETRLLFLRARYYDPTIGRFISPDSYPPSVLDPQTLNSYAYVENNPINLSDPQGLQPCRNVHGGNRAPEA